MPFVEGGPGKADREGGPRGGARGEVPLARERAVPERGEDRVLGEMRALAQEPVDGVELAGRRPRQEPAERGQEELARVLPAGDVGRKPHGDRHPEDRGKPGGETHRLL